MIELYCSKCGTHVRHKEAVKFIKDGWRYFGDVAYCPECVKICKNINRSSVNMAFYLLHMLSLDVAKLQKAEKLLFDAEDLLNWADDCREKRQFLKKLHEYQGYEK